jgi:oligopeptide/dipeptide ABC transporter ATP-binding protein
MSLLSARGLSKTFVTGHGRSARRVAAVQEVDLDIAAGECVGVVGESGSGKSTVARLILRLIEPDAGTLHFDGTDLRALDAGGLRRLRRSLQIVFQNPHSALPPRMTMGEALAEPLLIQGIAGGEAARRRALEMLDVIRLPRGFAHRYPHELSGGQKQRICIARALILQPRLVVLDEPTSALDVSVQAQILDLLDDLQRDLGLAYLFISHNLAVVRTMSRRVQVMYAGRVVEAGATEQVLHAPRHPYTRALLAATLEPEPDVVLPPAEPLASDPRAAARPACAFFARCPQRVTGLCDVTAPPVVETPSGMARCHRPLG